MQFLIGGVSREIREFRSYVSRRSAEQSSFCGKFESLTAARIGY